MLRNVFIGAVISLIVAACGQSSTTVATDSEGGDGGAAPQLEQPELSQQAGSQGAQTPLPTVSRNEFRSGAFAARVENTALTKSCVNCLTANMTLTIFNTGDQPMSIILLDNGDASLALRNGVTLRDQRSDLHHCSGSPSDCRVREAANYTQIDPHSQVSVNFVLTSVPTTAQWGSVPEVNAGGFSTRVHVIEGTGDRAVNLSFPNLEITNNAGSL